MNTNGGKVAKESVLVPFGVRKLDNWTEHTLTSVKFDTNTYLDGKVALLTISRPQQRNAWTEIVRNELLYCIDKANKMKKVRVIIITGDPAGNAFCFGADLNPASKENPNSVEGDAPEGKSISESNWRDGGGQVALAICRSVKPVLAAVNGSAVGVGMTLPLSCDISVVAEEAKIGFVFAKRGLAMECVSSFFLQKCVGYKVAMELVLTARVFQAKNAPQGLFNYVVPKDKVMDKTLELAREICETSGMSAFMNRTMILRNSYGISPEEAHLIESKALYFATTGEDAKEGINSFLQKRSPNFPLDPYKDSPAFFPFWTEVNTKPRL